MPRINIEEKWWSDPRRTRLVIKLGLEADSAMLNAIRVSQEHNGEPFDASNLLEPKWIQALLEVGLANGQPTLLYICGSKDHHNWLMAKRESGKRGGIKSAQLRQASLEHPSSEFKQIQPSSSSSSSKKEEYIKSGKPDPVSLSILTLLNEKLGKSFKPVDANLRHINARLKEGYGVEDFAFVIQDKRSEWGGSDFEKYLRPQTLFGPKFDSYLQKAKSISLETGRYV
jgi:uncharacterized phage protein (TIGR02220 family)